MTISKGKEEVMAVMTDPDQFSAYLGDLETLEKKGEDTWRLILKELSEKGVRFKGDYTVKYTVSGDTLTWETISQGNMSSTGRATFRARGEGATEVDYTETVECNMDVNRLLAKVIKPIVQREIARGVGSYLDRAKEGLER
jgi:carbon monoxide dehydrogenase subunit G